MKYVSKRSKQLEILLSIIVLLSFFICIDFARSDFRWHLYGKYVDNSAHTLTSTQIWFEEGPFDVKFASILSFKSVQYENKEKKNHVRHIGNLTFPSIIDNHVREVYISYPTGYILPLYIYSILKGETPTDVDIYNLNRVMSLILLLSLFFVLLMLTNYSYLLSSLTLASTLLTVGYIYFYQVFLSYNSIAVVYFSLFIFLRLLKKKSWSNSILFLGLLTDYLFFFVAIYQIISNLIEEKKINLDTITILMASFFAFGLFMFQLYALGLIEHIWWKLQFRLGLIDSVDNLGQNISDISNINIFRFILLYGFNVFKVVGPLTLLFPIFFIFLIYRSVNWERRILLLSCIPPILYTLSLRTSSMHEYETLKFIPAAVIIFGLIVKNYWSLRYFILLALGLINLANIYFFLPEYRNTNQTYTKSNFENSKERHSYNLFIKENTTHGDIIFALENDVEIWGGRLKFSVAPYMWWRDYPYRQRNLNRVSDLDSALKKIKEFNVSAENYIIIVNVSDLEKNSELKKLEKLAEDRNYLMLDIKPLLDKI